MHTLWECPKLRGYWEKVEKTIGQVTEVEVKLTSAVVSLGVWNEQTLAKYTLLFCNVVIMVAKRDVIKRWGDRVIPTWEEWLRGMDLCRQAEETVYKARGCPKKAQKIWGPLAEYREAKST